jgi:hypothetical protein
MGLRAAVANGNWSSTSTWNAGIIPVAGDVVASNGFTVTIDQNVNVDSITNAATSPVKVTPNMTGYTTPSGIVTASSDNTGSGRAVWQAFDGNGGTIGQHNNSGAGWIAYEFPTPKIINAYSWSSIANEQPYNWTFEGWDGTSWIILHTVTSGAVNYTSPLIGNNTAYIKYRINVSLVQLSGNRSLWYEINLFEKGTDLTAVAGGTFNLNSGVTVTCTGANGIYGSTATTLTYAGSGTSTINSPINASTTASISTLVHSGTGTLIVNGAIYGTTTSSANTTINFTSLGVLTINGNLYALGLSAGNSNVINMTTTGILNIVGILDVQGTQKQAITLPTGSTLNFTGDITVRNAGLNSLGAIGATSATINITGNLSITGATNSGNVGWYCLSATNCTINITGNLYQDNTVNAHVSQSYPLSVTGTSYLNHIGSMTGGRNLPAYSNTSSTSINILTGPFISGSTGTQPFYVARMHYRRTFGSYFEFRDNSTNGALPPAGSAPATRLVSPDTVVAAPIPANVRQGKSYALGSQTGTMIVPNPANVVKNVPVDNTVGTGALDPSAIWAVPISSLTTNNSIGQIVKKVATVETTGAQIQSTLNNNP